MDNQPPESKKRYDPRPWAADTLRDYIRYRLIEERMDNIGPATQKQAVYIARRMGDFWANKKDRLVSLNWLLKRSGQHEVTSTKAISKAEASVLIRWLHTNPEHIAQEAERVLSAALRAKGQIDLPLDGLPPLVFEELPLSERVELRTEAMLRKATETLKAAIEDTVDE